MRAECSLAALPFAKTDGATGDDLAMRLELTEKGLVVVLDVLLMRAQYFRDITDRSIKAAPIYAVPYREEARHRVLGIVLNC